MPITYHREGDVATITLSDRVDLYQAEELQRALVEGLSGSRQAAVDVSALSATDLSILQVLCAAHRASVRQGREFRLTGGTSLREYAVASGYARKIGCTDGCLWTNLEGD